MADPPNTQAISPAELGQRLEVERRGEPFLLYRDAQGEQRILMLGAGRSRVTVGRAAGHDVWLDFDEGVSLLHAVLERIGEHWTVIDDGLSRNGTYLNGERVTGRRALREGDVLRLGLTQLIYRSPAAATRPSADRPRADRPQTPALTDTQRQILVALCRPFKEGGPHATPATNRQIAEEVFLSVDAVKAHLRALFEKFGVEPLPHNQKRARLVELALELGLV